MIELQEEHKEENNLTPPAFLKVIGVGGAGGNTVNSIIDSGCEFIETIAVNTDAQALHFSKAHNKIQIGIKSTKGLGTGANPELGKRAAEEDLDKVLEFVDDTDIVFLTAGMGGGTGSGALPTIARALREKNILSIAIVSLPFSFEGNRRHIVAEGAIASLKKEVDTLIIIPNQKLLDIVDKHVSMLDAFAMINDVLVQSVKGITDIITKPGHINVDFADVRTIMKGQGLAVMGNAKASGENRAQEATLRAITSPLLENMSIKGAHSVLLNITGGKDLSLYEISEAATIIYKEAAEDAHIILGSVIDENIENEVSITVIATGFDDEQQRQELNKSLSDISHQADTIQAVNAEDHEVYQICKKDNSVKTEQQDETKEEQQNLKELINTKPAMQVDDEDLDVPTFLRKGSSKEEMF